MGNDSGNEMEWGKRDSIVGKLDRMVESGRVTAVEAEALRAATDADEFNRAVLGIRARHAGVQLDAAVADGSLGRTEADALLDRLRGGEHGSSLRARLRALRGHGRHRG